jgi:hypothetical protein
MFIDNITLTFVVPPCIPPQHPCTCVTKQNTEVPKSKRMLWNGLQNTNVQTYIIKLH